MTPCTTIPILYFFPKVVVNSSYGLQMLGFSPLEYLAWLDSPQMAALVWKKLQMTPCTIPNNTCLQKVAIKLSHGLPDVEVLPLGVVSLAELHPDGRRGPEKVANDSLYYPKQYLFDQKSL